MPGWYVHMEAARRMVEALADQDEQFPDIAGVADGQALATAAKRWRNYLALGAIGPDFFYLLPDFPGIKAEVLSSALHWVLEVYSELDDAFVHAWETYIKPIQNANEQLLSQLTGDISTTLNDIASKLQGAITNAVLSVFAESEDWFALFTSGVPQAYADSAFYWSDIFHYRRTYEFPQRLFQRARSWVDPTTGQPEAEVRAKLVAYALGWMSHCAVDVTGHPFINAKCGGPYRDHWQRHHLIENHIDAYAYDAMHGGDHLYGVHENSALHFWIAFREADPRSEYVNANGVPATDAPAYDYFTGFPDYSSMGYSPEQFFDLNSAHLPDELIDLLVDTMLEMWNDRGPGFVSPKVLLNADAQFRSGNTGVPSPELLRDTFDLLFKFLKFSCSSGARVTPPGQPPLFPNLDIPLPPGFAPDDPARGDDDHDFNFWDFLAALFAWPAYLAELGAWFAALGPAIVNDLATYGPREALYEYVEVPLWNAYLASRRAFVLAAILMPRHEEVQPGLVTLGVGPAASAADLFAALESPDGTARAVVPEPSGRTPGNAYGDDAQFPRDVVTDDPAQVASIFGLNINKITGWPDLSHVPSEFMRPWSYPDVNRAGQPVPAEASRTHAGPWIRGTTADQLLQPAAAPDLAAVAAARSAFETAKRPVDTEDACNQYLPSGVHLGNPIDYALYVVGRLTAAPDTTPGRPVPRAAIPDFNLDSDRGYGYRCWDWNRQHDSAGAPAQTFQPNEPLGRAPAADFTSVVPCTPPQGYSGTPALRYVAGQPLEIHYDLDAANSDPGCHSPRGWRNLRVPSGDAARRRRRGRSAGEAST